MFLSKAERSFLEDPTKFNDKYRYVIEHRLRAKLESLESDYRLLTEFSKLTEFGKGRMDLKWRAKATKAVIGTKSGLPLGSLHSMDSANACGALGRRFESGRAR